MGVEVWYGIGFALILSTSRLPFWRLPPHVDLAWWASWTLWSSQWLPPVRLLEFNQGGSRLALFLQFRLGRYFTEQLHLIQKLIDLAAMGLCLFATSLYLPFSWPGVLTLVVIALVLNNPRTQTYFSNSETQIVGGLAVVLVLLTMESWLASFVVGAWLTYHAIFHKVAFLPDMIVGFVFVPEPYAFGAGAVIVLVPWLLLQRKISIQRRTQSFLGHWSSYTSDYIKQHSFRHLLLRNPFVQQGRESTLALGALALSVWLWGDPSQPVYWMFWGHLCLYIVQLRAHPYHSIPGLFTGLLCVLPVLPLLWTLSLGGVLLAILLVQMWFPQHSFAWHPWEYFFRYNEQALRLRTHLQQHYQEHLQHQGLLVWSYHTNLFWLLGIKPHVSWLQVSASLSYYMVKGGHHELAQEVMKHPPSIVLVGNPTLNRDALERLTGFRYHVQETVEEVEFLIRGEKWCEPEDLGVPLFCQE